MIAPFRNHLPVKIRFGDGVARLLSAVLEEEGASRPFLIMDRGLDGFVPGVAAAIAPLAGAVRFEKDAGEPTAALVEQAAAELAERTLHAFSLPVSAGDRVLGVSLSIGIATSRHSCSHSEELLRDADVAMYEAKEGGKRRYAIFTTAMRDSIVRRHDLKGELERAIEERELLVQ